MRITYHYRFTSQAPWRFRIFSYCGFIIIEYPAIRELIDPRSEFSTINETAEETFIVK